MKMDELKDLKDLDKLFPTDPFEIYCYGEDYEKKKKKGKKDSGLSFKESLHELSKKELRKKAEEMGVDMRFVDTDSKKALRGAIMDARKASKKVKHMDLHVSDGQRVTAASTDSDKKALKLAVTPEEDAVIGEKPKFYFDMDTHDFIIHDADDAEDDVMLDAIRALGAIRREKRPDDGFGELMLRMDNHIKHGIALEDALDPATNPNVIEVDDYKVVDDDVKALPEGKSSSKKRK